MFKLGRTPESSGEAGEAGKAAAASLSSREQAEREAQSMLDQLRGQPGFGVVMTASEGAPRAPETRSGTGQGSTLGQRLTAEMEELARRERTLKEIRELAMRRVSEMTPEQIRRLLDFCS